MEGYVTVTYIKMRIKSTKLSQELKRNWPDITLSGIGFTEQGMTPQFSNNSAFLR